MCVRLHKIQILWIFFHLGLDFLLIACIIINILRI